MFSASGRPAALFVSVALCLAAVFYAPECRADDSWIKEAPSKPLLQPPFEKSFFAGEVGRIAITGHSALYISQIEGSEKGTVAFIPMKEKIRAGRKETLKDEYTALILLETPLETDFIAFKVITGKVNLEVRKEPFVQKLVKEGDEVRLPLEAFKVARARFINASDFRSTLTYELMSGGKPISKSSIRNRTITLEFKGSNSQKAWKTAADEVVVKVLRGEVVVRAGHPFDDVE